MHDDAYVILSLIGGLTAVMWTDFVETIILIGGAFVTAILGNRFRAISLVSSILYKVRDCLDVWKIRYVTPSEWLLQFK